MGMNSKIHVLLKTEDFNRLKEEAMEKQISLSDLCRLKILQFNQLAKLEFLLEKLNEKTRK